MKSIPEQLFEIPADWQQRVLHTSPGGIMNYGGVRDRMLAVAGWLQQKHAIRTGDRIAVCLPKDIETVCLIYGILAAGASFVPLHFNGPIDRLHEQLAEIAPSLLFTSDRVARDLASAFQPETLPAIVAIESVGDGSGLDRLPEGSTSLARPVPVDPDDLAAVYFTSGTTGELKGIMLSSRGLAGSVAALGAGDTLQRDDRMIGLTALHYAASIQIFYPVLGGCRIHLMPDDEVIFPDLVAAALRQQEITLWLTTATALRLLVDEISASDKQFETLRLVRFFGERMPVPTLRKAMDSMPHAVFENVYGASEAFSIMAHRVPRPLPDDFDALPLGRPTGQYRQALCDEAGNEMPPGEPGEICAIGDIVMAGYWNDREMTEASRLPGIANSFRTGDLAFCSANGNYCFVGAAIIRSRYAAIVSTSARSKPR
jgi:acyl-CoA synthetase (AMP-forming)/AMP-acid ligase II